MTLDEYEQAILREALKRAGGNKSQAARLLGLTRNALRYRLSQMGIES
jgi:DNA-binding NtrC family response regulator